MGLLRTAIRKAAGIKPQSLNLPATGYVVSRAPRTSLSPIPTQSPIKSNSIAATVKPFGGRK
jgi:hypothetical protein